MFKFEVTKIIIYCGDVKVTSKLLVAASIFLTAALPLKAQATVNKDKVAACAAIDNTVNRLECYDNLAKTEGLVTTSSTQKSTNSKWITNTQTDPLTDKSIYTSLLIADQGKGKYGDTIALLVRCQNNKTEMYIDWESFLGSDDIRTTYRVGKNPAKTSNWHLSTDKKAAFFPDTPIPTLKEFISVEDPSFVANVTPYNESPVTAVFDITGAEEALADIRKGCNW
ncbi:MAG TPA: DNA primase [Alcaligenaceae bacterium]|nr:DNA primase [Alcaligenaceae bacterium]